jgi:hypothetical protein
MVNLYCKLSVEPPEIYGIKGGHEAAEVIKPKLRARATVTKEVGLGENDPELPKVDGRKKDHPILAYAKTSGKSECLNGDDVCSPPEVLSIVSYFVKKSVEQECDGKKNCDYKFHEGKDSNKKNLESAKELLECDTEACVLTHPEFLKEVASLDNAINVNFIKDVLDVFFKPPGDISNHPQLGSSSASIAKVLKYWSTIFPDFCPIIPATKPDGQTIVDIKDMPLSKLMASFNLISSIEHNPQFKKYGFVMNNQLDSIRMGHAVAMYMDISEDPVDGGAWTIEFYNSHGTQPEEYIAEYLTRTANILKIYRNDKFGNDNVKPIIVSNIVTQGTSVECGLHALFYIKCRLEGVPYKWFREHLAPAEAMIQWRKHVYRDAKYQIF